MTDIFLAEQLKAAGFPTKIHVDTGDLVYYKGMVEMVDGIRELDKNEIYLPTLEEILKEFQHDVRIEYSVELKRWYLHVGNEPMYSGENPLELAAKVWIIRYGKK